MANNEEFEEQVIELFQVEDIAALRMAVRAFTRNARLDLASQSSISLAISHMATILGPEIFQESSLLLSPTQSDSRKGVQMRITGLAPLNRRFIESAFDQIRGLIDELYIDFHHNKMATVRMVKWMQSRQIVL